MARRFVLDAGHATLRSACKAQPMASSTAAATTSSGLVAVHALGAGQHVAIDGQDGRRGHTAQAADQEQRRALHLHGQHVRLDAVVGRASEGHAGVKAVARDDDAAVGGRAGRGRGAGQGQRQGGVGHGRVAVGGGFAAVAGILDGGRGHDQGDRRRCRFKTRHTVPTRTICSTPAAISSSKAAAAPGAPTPWEQTVSGRPS